TDGIGKLAAFRLAKDGHTIILHGRNTDKLKAVANEIVKETANENILHYSADLSNLKQIDNLAKSLNEDLDHLDVLINNAGVFKSQVAKNDQGIDLRFMVNYLAPYHLSNLLLPLLHKSKDARIINLSSAAQSKVSFELLKGNGSTAEQSSYAQSKLALTMWSFHLASQLKELVVIAVNPGSLLNTKMVQEAYGKSWSSADKGSNILYKLATEATFKSESGKYFDNDLGDPQGKFGQAHPDAYNETLIYQLVAVTDELLQSLSK
ncbi:MAG: SDR family NAD(P)-dependent oxidoreductase, partial [Bacteroidota bacterium]